MQKVSLTHSLLAAVAVALIVAGAAMAQAPITMNAGAAQVEWQATVPGSLLLNVSGPEGFHVQERFAPGEAAVFSVFDASGNLRPAGSYTFEVRVEAVVDSATQAELDAIRASGGDGALGALQKAGKIPTEPTVYSGYFAIEGGAIAFGGEEEPGAGPAAGGNQISAKDQVINDDLIVTGSICVGFDCVNGENFGFDTLRLKENNLRIKFQDTSNSGSFPSNDWQITANDSANGGANKFSIDDIDGGRTPFTIEASAPSNSLYVDDGGRIGLGTATPVVQLHQVDGNTPTLRLQQDGSSGFTPQTWDVAGNETNFFVRDATNGSTLPLRIKPSAPSNSIYIDADGNVGFGTASPAEAVHASRSGDVALVLQDTSGSGSSWLFKNNTSNGAFTVTADAGGGNAPFKVFPSVDQNTLVVGTPGGAERVGINVGPSSIAYPLHVGTDSTNGNGAHVTNGGAWTNGSSRASKKDIIDLDGNDALSALADLDPVRFKYKGEPGEEYVGFIAEDVPELVAQGDRKTLSTMDIVAVLTKVVKMQQETIATQNAAIEELKEKVEKLDE